MTKTNIVVFFYRFKYCLHYLPLGKWYSLCVHIYNSYFEKCLLSKNDNSIKLNYRKNKNTKIDEKYNKKLVKINGNANKNPKKKNLVLLELKKKYKKVGQDAKYGKGGYSFVNCRIGWQVNLFDNKRPNKMLIRLIIKYIILNLA